jgi:peptide/nickel transport system permease protein
MVGLIMILGLMVFSWLGPSLCHLFGYSWGEIETDRSGKYVYGSKTIEYTDPETGELVIYYQVSETYQEVNSLAEPSGNHLLGTDKTGKDVFIRLMYGGRISLSISFIAVFAITILGIIFGGIAGYFGGWVDNVIMRICDILMCLPGMPLLLILGTILDAAEVPSEYRIYVLMTFLTIFSWSGIARLVRGQILYLREQEYMVAAEAMGFSTVRKIFKHLIPNIMPQLIVSMTLSLGSMILYEASLSYLGMGVRAPYAAWGTMINIIASDVDVLKNYFNVWGPPGFCIVLAVLGFNFLGDGLRDALDPKMRR